MHTYSDQITVENKAHLECNFFLSGVMHITPYGNSKEDSSVKKAQENQWCLTAGKRPDAYRWVSFSLDWSIVIYRPYRLRSGCIGTFRMQIFTRSITYHSACHLSVANVTGLSSHHFQFGPRYCPTLNTSSLKENKTWSGGLIASLNQMASCTYTSIRARELTDLS